MKRATLAEADLEATDAVAYYHAARKGWGRKFSDALNVAFQSITTHPEIGVQHPEGYRRLNLRGFPYYVAYAIRGDILWIVAIAHAKRKPKYWIKRLKRL